MKAKRVPLSIELKPRYSLERVWEKQTKNPPNLHLIHCNANPKPILICNQAFSTGGIKNVASPNQRPAQSLGSPYQARPFLKISDL